MNIFMPIIESDPSGGNLVMYMNVFTKNLSGLKRFSFKRAGSLLFDPLYNYNTMKMVLIIIVIFLFSAVYPRGSKEI